MADEETERRAEANRKADDKAQRVAKIENSLAPKADEATDTPAPKSSPVAQSAKTVKVTITKFGAGKVSTGLHVAGEGDIMADRGHELIVSETIAAALEAKGLAET